MTAAPPALPYLNLPLHQAAQPDAPGVLAGVRVADFSHYLAGPLCTQILADMGAEIIKVEPPGRGDDFRSNTPRLGGEAGTFLWANRNKKSLALDLATPEGREVAQQLIGSCDILVENFSAGVMEKFGLDHASLCARHPALVYCSISGYGRTGPMAKRLSFDPTAQAESGFMWINGLDDGPGVMVGIPVMDMTTGMMACSAILGALFARQRNGIGQHVEVAMVDQAVAMLAYKATNYLITGESPARAANRSAITVPVGVFETRDRPLYLACTNDRIFARFSQAVGHPEWLERWASNPARVQDRDALHAVLRSVLQAQPCDEWIGVLREAAVPVAPVRTVAENLASDDVRTRGLLSRIPHPTAGFVPNVAPPFRFSESGVAEPRAAPLLGQHSAEVLAQLGVPPERVQSLRDRGIVQIAAA